MLLMFTLFGVGFTTLYSGSTYYAERLFDNNMYFVSKQLKHFIVALIAMLFFFVYRFF